MSARATADQQYDFPPWPSVGGPEKYRAWRNALMRQAAGMRDKSGSTIADYYMGIAMGGPNPGAPPMPVAGGASVVTAPVLPRLCDRAGVATGEV